MNSVWPVSFKRQVKDAGTFRGTEIQLSKTPIKGTSLTGKIGPTTIRDKAGRLYGKSSTPLGTVSYTTGKITLTRERQESAYEISYDLNEALING